MKHEELPRSDGPNDRRDAIEKLLRAAAEEEREILAELATGPTPSLTEARAIDRFRQVIDRRRVPAPSSRARVFALAAAITLAATAAWLASTDSSQRTGASGIVLGSRELGLSWVLPTNPATSFDEFRCSTTKDPAGITFELVIEAKEPISVAPLLVQLGSSPVWKPSAAKRAKLPRSLRATMSARAPDGRVVDSAVLETALAP